jgi:hypothetical protein
MLAMSGPPVTTRLTPVSRMDKPITSIVADATALWLGHIPR